MSFESWGRRLGLELGRGEHQAARQWQLGSGRHRLMMPPALSALGLLLHDAVSGGSVRSNAQRQGEEGAPDLSPMSF